MTAILLCGDGLAGRDIGEGLARSGARVVPELCRRPDLIRELAAGSDRLVLGLCGERHSLGAVQRETRKAGLDPLGVEIVDQRAAGGDLDRLEVMVAGAVARATAFAGSRPEHAKLDTPREASRRALLTFSLPEYHGAPAVEMVGCAAGTGCHACVGACPSKAISIESGRVVIDRSRCEPCGRCVTACPTGAIVVPTCTAAQLDGQVRAIVDPDVGTPGWRGILYTCRRATRAESAEGWYPVVVPCAGMVTTGWLLAPLLMGAAAVGLRPCSEAGCARHNDALVHQRVDFARTLLTVLGAGAERVTSAPDAPPSIAPLPPGALHDAFGPLGGPGVAVALAARFDAEHAVVDQPGSPAGVIHIRPEACTGCAMCAVRCPTGALTATRGDRLSITFDPARCTACAQCVPGCPEAERDAIRLSAAVDLPSLRAGVGELFGDEEVRCAACGKPVAPEAMMARMRELLDDDGSLLDVIGRTCIDCRGFRPVAGSTR